MKNNLRQVKKINKEISGALKFWQDMLLISDADQWSYLLNYSEEDLLQSYTEGLAEGYVQGYGDCFYGNKKELDISEYTDEEYYYE